MRRCGPASRKVVVSEQFLSLVFPLPFPLKGYAEPAKSPSHSNPALTASITSAAFVHRRRHEKQPVAGGLGKHQGRSAPEKGKLNLLVS